MIVEVYRNLTKACFSVRKRGGRVLFHTTKIVLKDASFVVNESGRDKVRKTGHKNVHAFVRGTIAPIGDFQKEGAREVTYNPYVFDTFVVARHESEIDHAPRVCLDYPKVWVEAPIYYRERMGW